MRPGVPLSCFVLYFGLAVSSVAAQGSTREFLRFSEVIVSAMLTFKTTQDFLLPLCALFSKSASNLFRTFVLSVQQMLRILPFFVVFIVAFAFGGSEIFNGNVADYARRRFAVRTIGKAAAYGGIEYAKMIESRPILGPILDFMVVIVLLIVVGNLILAVVITAATDANKSSDPVQLAEAVLSKHNFSVHRGRLYEVGLAWRAFLGEALHLKSFSGKTLFRMKRRPLPRAICRGDGKRILFPCECLACVFGPKRTNELLRAMNYYTVPKVLYGSLVPYLLMVFDEWSDYHPGPNLADECLEHGIEGYREWTKVDSSSSGGGRNSKAPEQQQGRGRGELQQSLLTPEAKIALDQI